MADIEESEPIGLVLTGSVRLTANTQARYTNPHGVKPLAMRATPSVVLAADEPVVVGGVPLAPANVATVALSVTVTQGADHVHAVDDPDPVWDPVTGSWSVPPGPSGVGDYRWTVQTLPDPGAYVTGRYPLGAASAHDETTEIEAGARQWKPDAATGGPNWDSAWPFKPVVAARDSVLADGSTVKHPKGVLFSSANDAHMWLDLGAAKTQPFTWVLVVMPLRDGPVRQAIMDAGRNPYDVGSPEYTEAQLGDEHAVDDGLAYRSHLSIASWSVRMDTKSNGRHVDVSSSRASRPRMIAAVFDGSDSVLYVRDVVKAAKAAGTVDSGTGYDHRYFVLGRRQGLLSPTAGCEMVVFEARYWHSALDDSALADQYDQLSATYQFSRYR